jgi:hypothetical protein
MTRSRRRGRWGCAFTPRAGRCRSGSRGRAAARQSRRGRNRILSDCIRVIDRFHDPRPGAMIRVAVAPCSPFSVSRELMRDAALLARDKGVMMHTHLAENDEDVAYSLENFGCRPGQYAEDLGWTGGCLARPLREARRAGDRSFARSRLASPIAPVPTAASPRASRRWPGCAKQACRWALAWTARPPTTAATSWPRRGRRCFAAGHGRGGGVFGARCAAGWPRAAGRRFWAVAANAGRSRRGSAPISRSGTCPASRRRAVGTPPRCFWPVRRGCAT